MNILLLNVSKGWGGTESHTITLASLLKRNGNKIAIGCLKDGKVGREAEKLFISVKKIRLMNTLEKFIAAFDILRAAREEKADAIVSNCGNEVLPAAFAGRFLGAKLIFYMHGIPKISWLKRLILSRYFDSIVAVSNVVGDFLIKKGIPKRKITVIHNGIDMDRFNPGKADREAVRKELGISPDEKVIGTAARLCPEKGLFELLYAFSRIVRKYPNVRLLIVGEGQSKAGLRALAEELSFSDRVIFTGLRYDMERMYSAMDVFVLSSIWDEPFGLVVIEAMAMKKPVIATSVGGIVEIIENGHNGILVPRKDINALSDAISRLMEDNEFSDKIALEGFKTVQRNFSSSIMAEKFQRRVDSL